MCFKFLLVLSDRAFPGAADPVSFNASSQTKEAHLEEESSLRDLFILGPAKERPKSVHNAFYICGAAGGNRMGICSSGAAKDSSLGIKNVTAKPSLNLSLSVHTWVMASPKLGPRVKLFESFSSLNTMTHGPSLGDAITQVWPEMERLSHIFAVPPFICK